MGCSRTATSPVTAPMEWSPRSGGSRGAPSASWPTIPRSRPARGDRAPWKRSSASRRQRCGYRCRSSTWWTRPGLGSPIRFRCSPDAVTRAASSTRRCSSRASCRKSACPSAPPPRAADPKPPVSLEALVPEDEGRGFNMQHLIDGVVDEGSFFEIKKLYAKELICGLARIGGRVISVVANQPMQKGGILFVDSADKAARFIWLCDAFHIPLLFLADVPGFMIGTAVERQGIIRHGAKLIAAVAESTVPKISVIVRKAYGAGLYAMAGPAYEPNATLALPTAMIGVMGPSAAVNAVFYNKIQELPEDERPAYVKKLQDEYREDIDLYRLASDLIVDGVVAPAELRTEHVNRFAAYATSQRPRVDRKHGVFPV